MRPTGLSASADLILASDDPHGAGRARDEARGQRVSAQRCDELRLTGSGGANRVMEAELKRLVMRSPFDVRLEKPKREGEATLLYPFDARIAWVAACHHRTSSRISWDLCSSAAVRLEPLFDDLLPALSSDDRLPGGAPPALLGRGRSLVRLRGVATPAPRRRQERDRRGAWRHEASRPKSTPTRLTSCSSCAAPERLERGVRSSASTSAAERGIAAARAWPPGLRRCARRWRRS